ncbi:hypothetical protein [Streptomyces sp. NPDC004065]|uniref:hypothetical protein n=1 Tax=Streptomyces sp. NPDC004065 TaxID=3364689 RepID=UPI0038514D38
MRYEEEVWPPARWLMVPAGLDIEIAGPRGGERHTGAGGFGAASPCPGEECAGHRPDRTAPPPVCRHCGAARP